MQSAVSAGQVAGQAKPKALGLSALRTNKAFEPCEPGP